MPLLPPTGLTVTITSTTEVELVWTMQGLADKYNFYKEIYDWFVVNA